MQHQPFRLKVRVALWMRVMLFTPTIIAFFALQGVFQGAEGAVAALGLFSLLALLGWLNIPANILVTEEDVTVSVFYGRFRIRWSEIKKIILSPPLIALEGIDKRVVLATSSMDKNTQKMFEYFSKQIELRKIEFSHNEPIPMTHKNSKI